MTRHPLRWGSLVFGLAFATVVVVWAVAEQGLVTAEAAGAGVAVALIVAGVIGVVATIRVARPRTGSPHDQHDDRLDTSGTDEDRRSDVPHGPDRTDTRTDTAAPDDEETTDGQEARTQH